jgi:hypothetical protein
MPELTFSYEKESLPFVISIPVRDGLGNPTGRNKVFEAQTGAELCDWYERNAWRGIKKKKKKPKPKKKIQKRKG